MLPGARLAVSQSLSRGWRRHFGLPVGGLLLLLLAPAAQAGILDLSWDAPTTNVDGTPLTDLASYRVYAGTSSAPCPGPSHQVVPSPTSTPTSGDVINYRLTGLITGTTYDVRVTAVDTNGNESVCSNRASGAAKADSVDTTAPTGTIKINNNAPYTQWTAATLSLTATDAVGVMAYYISTSSTSPSATATGWVAVTPTTSYSNTNVPFTLPSGNGTKTVYAWYKDAAGNVSPTASDAIILDQTAPTVSLSAPTAGQTVSGSVTVSATASDASGVAGVQFKLDGGNLLAEDTTSPFSISWSTPTATNGSHTLTAVARDVAGNTTTSAGVTVTVSNTLPAITSGLVAAYAFNEGSGTSVADASGNGHTGTISGAIWTTAGRYGNALAFNGSDGSVSVANPNLPAGDYTWEVWVNPNQTTTFQALLVARGLGVSAGGIELDLNSAGRIAVYSNGALRLTSAAALPVGSWSHVALTRAGGTLRLYVNGTADPSTGTDGLANSFSTCPLLIGVDNDSGCTGALNGYFAGRLDEVRIYGRALSASEIQADMNAPIGGGSAATPPTGALTINGNAANTNTTAVTMNLTASHGVGVTGYYLSTGSTPPSASASGWVAVTATTSFSTNVPYTLPSGDGIKTVYAWYKDAAGNMSPTASDSIRLDQTAPTNGTLTATAGNAQVSLSWSGFTDSGSGLASTNRYKLVFSTGGTPATSCTSGTQLLLGTATSFTRTALTNGTTYYYRVCALDNAGNSSTGARANARPSAGDTTRPTGTIRINGNAAYTNTTAVTMNLTASDAVGVTGYYLSTSYTSPTAGGTGWVTVTPTTSFSRNVSYTLPSGDGIKIIYAWYKDGAGNVSARTVDSIRLDRTPPTNGTLTATAGNAQVSLSWSEFTDGGTAWPAPTAISWSSAPGAPLPPPAPAGPSSSSGAPRASPTPASPMGPPTTTGSVPWTMRGIARPGRRRVRGHDGSRCREDQIRLGSPYARRFPPGCPQYPPLVGDVPQLCPPHSWPRSQRHAGSRTGLSS